MRFLDLLVQKRVPEWARCYYDYEGASILIKHASKVLIILEKMRDFRRIIVLPQQGSQSEEELERQGQETDPLRGIFQQKGEMVLRTVEESNRIFFLYHRLNKNVVFLFCQLKIHELNKRIDRYEKWAKKVELQKEAYLALLSNLFYEGKMLYRMCEVNLTAYKKVQKKHSKTFSQFALDSPFFQKQRLTRTMEQLESYFLRLEGLYLTTRELYPKKARSQLYQQLQPNPLYESIASYVFGLTNGISVSLIILSIIIFTKESVYREQLRFERDFPVWRGVGYLLLFMWMFAIDIAVFQKLKINYQLVFGFKKMTPRSAFVLALASAFTFVYLSLFVFYLLDLTQLLPIESGIAYYFPLAVWALLLVYMLLPLPILNYQGRIFFFKQLLNFLVSPFTAVHFNVIFITEQLISLVLPFSDICYTFCYYIEHDIDKSDPGFCSKYLHTAQYFGIGVFTYRLIQCLKVAWHNDMFLGTREMYIVFRALANIFMLVLSILANQEQALIVVWLVFAFPVLLFNYYVDLKWDWGLLESECKHLFLRDYLAFQPHQYYIIMSVNLVFRLGALLSLSENIIYLLELSPLYVVFAIASVEIVRRFFWNIIKVERQHVENCSSFTVKTDYKQNQDLITEQLYGYNQDDSDLPSSDIPIKRIFGDLQEIRHSEEIQNLKKEIEKKKQMREKIDAWKKTHKELLEFMEAQIQQIYEAEKSKKQ